MTLQRFRQLLQASFKSNDTEEWLDVHFTRPIGLLFALLWNRLGVHPNAITILSIFLGVGAGVMFYFSDWHHNFMGVMLLMLANFCDSTDGQMARLTGKKTLIGRILDGLSGDLWFSSIYIAIALRLFAQPMPLISSDWGFWAWALVVVAGLLCHARQSSLADYYRQIHLYVLKGEAGSELHSSEIVESHHWWERIFFSQYARYCRSQEQRTPRFQQLFHFIKHHHPLWPLLSQEFLSGSRPLMKYTNLLTFNARAIILYVSALFDCVWLYPLLEITLFECMYLYMWHQHEMLCGRLTHIIQSVKAIAFDYGGTLDTGGRHWFKVIVDAYQHAGFTIERSTLYDAYVYAEKQLGVGETILPTDNFRVTLKKKVALQFAYLGENFPSFKDQSPSARIVDECYEVALCHTSKNKKLLAELHQHYPIALVSNFYGNLSAVLDGFGLSGFFSEVAESAQENIRKPDSRLWSIAIDRLDVQPEQVLIVGDSLKNDILPARHLGCFALLWKA